MGENLKLNYHDNKTIFQNCKHYNNTAFFSVSLFVLKYVSILHDSYSFPLNGPLDCC